MSHKTTKLIDIIEEAILLKRKERTKMSSRLSSIASSEQNEKRILSAVPRGWKGATEGIVGYVRVEVPHGWIRRLPQRHLICVLELIREGTESTMKDEEQSFIDQQLQRIREHEQKKVPENP